jgi:outer membrane immunogenic protein
MTKIDARVRRALLGLSTVVALAAGTHQATAAEPIYNWAGFYIGANAGYGWGHANSSLSIADGGANCHFCGLGNDVSLAQQAGSPSFSPKGFVGGGQFGYNWQASNWVYGIETEFSAFQLDQTAVNSVALPANTFAFGLGSNCDVFAPGAPTNTPCVGHFSTSVKTNWLFTLRPRLGYAWDQSMIYLTGGLALTKVSFSQSYSDNISFGTPPGGAAFISKSSTQTGWTIGGGVERGFGTNWSGRLEYLYTRFDGLGGASGTLTDGFNGNAGTFTNNVGHLSANILRAGINYRFGAK